MIKLKIVFGNSLMALIILLLISNALNSHGMGSTPKNKSKIKLVMLMPFNELYQSGSRLRELAKAAGKGDIKKIDSLIREGLSVNEGGVENVTALFWALREGNLEGFKRLLEHGADPNVVFGIGGTVMHWATARVDTDEYLRLALQHGGNPNLQSGNYHKETPIFDAVRHGYLDRVNLLLDYGANIDYQDAFFGSTPVSYALPLQGDIAFSLLERGADYSIKSNAGYDVAADVASGKVKVLKDSEQYKWLLKIESWLKERGVNLPPVNEKGWLVK